MSEIKRYSEEDIDYARLAAFVDGEGTITIKTKYGNYATVALYMSSTDRVLINWLNAKFGGYIYPRSMEKGLEKGWRQQYEWQIGGYKACKLIEKMKQWLIIKKDHAELILKFQKECKSRQYGRGRPIWMIKKEKKFIQKIRELNQRGAKNEEEKKDLPLKRNHYTRLFDPIWIISTYYGHPSQSPPPPSG